MPETANKNLSPIEAITASIDTDTHVYRWFLLMVLHPSIQSRVSDHQTSVEAYRKLNRVMKAQGIIGAVFLAALTAAAAWRAPGLLVLGAALLFLAAHLHRRKKRAVITIARRVLTSDPAWPILTQQTLYKISEQYSRELHIPSMVDIVCFSNRMLRRALVGGFVLTVIILPFRGLANALAFLMAYLTVYMIVNMRAISRRIK